MINEDSGNAVQKQEQGKNILIIVLLILVIISGVKLYYDHQDKAQKTEEILVLSEENTDLNQRLDSITYELDLRINEIRQLGGDIDSLVAIKDRLIMERNSNRNRSNAEIAQLNQRIDGYGRLLKEKDEDIVRLKAMNERLFSENTELKSTKAEIEEEVVKLNQKAIELEEKVNVAAKLRAENIVIAAVNSRGREREGKFRNRQQEKLKISFSLADNPVAPFGTRDIYVQILSPNNQVIFDIAKGSGTFSMDGREEFYTARQNIMFNNTLQRLTYFYEKGTDYAKGTHTVRVFADGLEIGDKTFEVK
jgi:Tfp pilus assembly protein PilN